MFSVCSFYAKNVILRGGIKQWQDIFLSIRNLKIRGEDIVQKKEG